MNFYLCRWVQLSRTRFLAEWGTARDRRRMYEMFGRQLRDAVGQEDFRTGCFELGLQLSPVEAVAVFGLCDARVDANLMGSSTTTP